jgi:uroporphyrin-III C-methyltransferase/precorrin-2 dehydrogenase/sirohydrochlorin ferrochelatase
MSGRGFVSIVGAGPGHPDYLTVKAAKRLREADLVLHDALVDRAVLLLAEQADWVDVGKRAGALQTPQAAIEQALIDAASRGLRVVRLKGGDPFVFGRGGEEALALQAAGIPFEVIPGVSTAVSAPALSGIPVTHRGVSSAFIVITTVDDGTSSAVVDALPPGLVTVVAMMSLAGRAVLATRLLRRGWPAETPAAVVLGASTAQHSTWRGTLAGLAGYQPPPASASAPGTIVIGAVAGLQIALEHGVAPAGEAVGL